jgi:hypothetical protein
MTTPWAAAARRKAVIAAVYSLQGVDEAEIAFEMECIRRKAAGWPFREGRSPM